MDENRNGEKTKSPYAPGVVRVRVLDKATKALNGDFMHMGLDVARRGEAKGLWKILPNQTPR
jgi:hypothetical protein